jgi:hypothetical protein
MATETYTRLVDDLDGGRAERTVSFSLDGRQFSIDLSKRNIAALEKTLQPYIAAARRGEPAGRKSRAAKGSKASGAKRDLKAVREWASANGFTVSDRGRISAEVQSAYDAAR